MLICIWKPRLCFKDNWRLCKYRQSSVYHVTKTLAGAVHCHCVTLVHGWITVWLCFKSLFTLTGLARLYLVLLYTLTCCEKHLQCVLFFRPELICVRRDTNHKVTWYTGFWNVLFYCLQSRVSTGSIWLVFFLPPFILFIHAAVRFEQLNPDTISNFRKSSFLHSLFIE